MNGNLPKFAFSHVIPIDAPMSVVWPALRDYATWNPGFVGATVTTVRGTPGVAGELVRIAFEDGDEIYAETIRMIENAHLTWFVTSAVQPDLYQEFLDFGLEPGRNGGVRFVLSYYGVSRTPDADVEPFHADKRDLLPLLASALKQHLEQ